MNRILRPNVITRLGIPLLVIAVGFIIPSWDIKIPLWIIALLVLAIGIYNQMIASDSNSSSELLLILISLYVLGTVILPFAIIGGICWAIIKLVVWLYNQLCKAIKRHQEGLKRFFIPLALNIAIWSIPLSLALIKDFLIFFAVAWSILLVLGFFVFYSIKLVQRHKNCIKYLGFNCLILGFSICSAITGIMHPEWITLDWCGLFLILWLAQAFIILAVASFIAYAVMSIILICKK